MSLVSRGVTGALYGALGGLLLAGGTAAFDKFTGACKPRDPGGEHLQYVDPKSGKIRQASSIMEFLGGEVIEELYMIYMYRSANPSAHNSLVYMLECLSTVGLRDEQSSTTLALATKFAMRADASARAIYYSLKDSRDHFGAEKVEDASKIIHIKAEEVVDSLRYQVENM